MARIRLILYHQIAIPANTQYMSVEVEDSDKLALVRALQTIKYRNKGFYWRWCGERK